MCDALQGHRKVIENSLQLKLAQLFFTAFTVYDQENTLPYLPVFVW